MAKAKSLQATTYSTTGFLKQSVFTFPNLTADSSCSSVSYVTGYAVNVCFQSVDYAFMFKLTAGASKHLSICKPITHIHSPSLPIPP